MKRRRRLWHIIRKTKVIEELVGLLISMVLFAILLARLEPGVATFGDGFWYTFSVVTTIGFGDIVVVTVVVLIIVIVIIIIIINIILAVAVDSRSS